MLHHPPPQIIITEKGFNNVIGQVDHSIPPVDRGFTQLTSLEQIWNMPMTYNGKLTWKFWFIVAIIIYLALWSGTIGFSAVRITKKKSYKSSYYDDYYDDNYDDDDYSNSI